MLEPTGNLRFALKLSTCNCQLAIVLSCWNHTGNLRFALKLSACNCQLAWVQLGGTTLEGEHFAILLTFIKPPFFIKIFVLSSFEWLIYTGFTIHGTHTSRQLGLFYSQNGKEQWLKMHTLTPLCPIPFRKNKVFLSKLHCIPCLVLVQPRKIITLGYDFKVVSCEINHQLKHKTYITVKAELRFTNNIQASSGSLVPLYGIHIRSFFIHAYSAIKWG